MVRIDDETIDADRQKVVHHIGNNGAAVQGKERFGTMLGQRPEPDPQACAQDKGCLEPSSFQ
jgi:hypothetical protein